MLRRQIVKLKADGKAVRINGYFALLGFGIIRIRNQTKAPKPIREKNTLVNLGLILLRLFISNLEMKLFI